MKFELTEEQRELKDSVRRWMAASYAFEHRLALGRGAGFERATWQSFADMGWLMAGIPEEFGGLGLGPVESSLIAEELGRGLVLEPFTACGLLPAAIVRECARDDLKAGLLGDIGSGAAIVAVAHSEPAARGRVAHVATRAERRGNRYVLHGRKSLVVGAPVADRLFVVARTSGAVADEHGIAVFVVDATRPGVSLERYALVDGTPAADLVLDGLELEADALLGDERGALPGLQRAIDEAIVAVCAETVGGVEDALGLCSDYLKTRRQFGVPIGSFQALQHRMADMAIERMQARATLHRALAVLMTSPDAASVAISGCKAQVTKSARFVAQQAIQLHGGYGITEEYRVGHHWRRLVFTDAQFGNMEFHLNRYARQLQAEASGA